MPEKCVLCFSGGTMAGMFGAGVGGGLLERNIEDRIEAIYGGSAGVFNAAYFLSRQFPVGPSIYYEELTENFILGKNIPFGVFQRFCRRYFGAYPGKLRQAVDIDMAIIDVVMNKKPLDMEKVQRSPVPLYVKVWDIRNKKWLFVDLRTYPNPFQLLKAAISVVPYYFNSENINGSECVDLCLSDSLTVDLIAARHPDSKIVFIANYTDMVRLLLLPIRFVEGVVASWCFPELDRMCFVKGMDQYTQDVKKIKKNPNFLLITPPVNVEVTGFMTDREKLLKVYEAGRTEAGKIVEFMEGTQP